MNPAPSNYSYSFNPLRFGGINRSIILNTKEGAG